MKTAVRALLLAALILVIPVSAAYAGPKPDGQLPYQPTTTQGPTTTKGPSIQTVVPVTTAARAQGLAQTGSDSTPLVWAGVAALAVGGVLVIGARRRAAVRR